MNEKEEKALAQEGKVARYENENNVETVSTRTTTKENQTLDMSKICV